MPTSIESFDNIVFDFGDTLATLVPSRERLCMEVLRDLGYGHSEERIKRAYAQVEFFMHQKASALRSMDKKAEFYSGFNYQLALSLRVERDHKRFDELMQRHFGAKKHWTVFPEVVGALSTLRRGHSLYVLANWDSSLAGLCRANNIDSFFYGIYCSEELGAEKPDTAIFREFALRAGIKPERSIYVGNEYLADVVGSRNCGFTPVLVDRDRAYSEDGDCYYIHSLSELIENK